MKTRLIKLGRGKAADKAIKEAAEVLRGGGLLGIPTETVYGIAANAGNAQAMEKLRRLKERGKSEPFTLLIAEKERVSDYVDELSWPGAGLVKRGWPGPLTLIFELGKGRAAGKAKSATSWAKNVHYRGTIGLRCPDHPGIRKLLKEAACPVVAPSANRKGQEPAVEAGEVMAELDGELELVLICTSTI